MDISHVLQGGRAGMLDQNNQPLASSQHISPMINGVALYGLHNRGVDGLVSFRQVPPADVQQMCHLATQMLGRSFPPGYNRLDFDFFPRDDDDETKGYTESQGDRSVVTLGLTSPATG